MRNRNGAQLMSDISQSDRHQLAVASSLQWADEAAARGDYGRALSWLRAIEAIGDELPASYQEKRVVWLDALS